MTTREMLFNLKLGIYLALFPLLFSCSHNKKLTNNVNQQVKTCVKEGNTIEIDSSYNFSIHSKSHSSIIYHTDSSLVIYKAIGSYHKDKRIGKWEFYIDTKIVKRIYYSALNEIIQVEFFKFDTGKLYRKLSNKQSEYELYEYDENGKIIKTNTFPSFLLGIEKNGVD